MELLTQTKEAKTMSKRKEFLKWCQDTNVDFKREDDHEAVVLRFDPNATVWFHYPNPFLTDPVYDLRTCVRFSDSSELMFNYKGE